MSSESLVATRARRANAGSRLKKLIELEEQSIEERQNIIYTEDDENVNLLFQEDENDEEFEESESDDEENEGDDDQEEGEEGEEGGSSGDEGQSVDGESKSKKRLLEEQADADDVLSDSDLSVTDSDESEGEKELHRQEKVKKKKLKKKHTIIPTIRQPKAASSTSQAQKKVIKKQKIEFTSDSLLNAKRASSRSAAVENKHALAMRLKADEERRAALKPVVRQEQVEMTQEERLAEAVETEKANVISLNQFREQEIVKKENQRQMLLSKRVKLTNVIRLVSEEFLVTPAIEMAEARRIYDKENQKSKKRPGRRKKADPEPITILKRPGDIDVDLPYVKIQMEKERIEREKKEKEEQELKEKEEKEREREVQDKLTLSGGEKIEGDEVAESIEEVASEVNTVENQDADPKPENTSDTKGDLNTEESDKPSAPEGREKDKTQNALEGKDETIHIKLEDSGSENEVKEVQEQSNDDAMELDVEDKLKDSKTEEEINSVPEGDKDIDTANTESKNETVEAGVPNVDESETKDLLRTKESEDSESSGPKEAEVQERRVKFADEVNEGDESMDATITPKEEANTDSKTEDSISATDEEVKPESEVFIGPPQRVSRNMIYMLDFDDEKDHNLIESNIKSILFGKQSLLPASRRFKDLKQIVKIGESDNPYITIVSKKDELFEPATDLSETDPLFEELKKLPRFGDFEDIVEEEEEDNEEVTSEIILKTEAPTSLYLPNGNKKSCLITGTEVKYFDPANGIPYSSVETYRLLKQIEQGNVPWFSFGNDANDNGGGEFYLGMREGERHAKGVPEGFEG